MVSTSERLMISILGYCNYSIPLLEYFILDAPHGGTQQICVNGVLLFGGCEHLVQNVTNFMQGCHNTEVFVACLDTYICKRLALNSC